MALQPTKLRCSLRSASRLFHCSQQYATRCPRTSPTPSPSSPQKLRAPSLNSPTHQSDSQQSTSWRLQSQSLQTGCLQHDHSPSHIPLKKENPRALEPLLSFAEEAYPMPTTRNPSLTRMKSGRMRETAGRLQHHRRP